MTRAARIVLVALVSATALLVSGTVMALTLPSVGGPPGRGGAHSTTLSAPGPADDWSPLQMSRARPRDPRFDDGPTAAPSRPGTSGASRGFGADSAPSIADAKPPTVTARAQPRPYSGPEAAVAGKVFFNTSSGLGSCSGTVVADPARPGRSNLVWTAAHCVHGGAGGTWFGGIRFVPAFNSGGGATPGNPNGPDTVAPYGQWRAVRAVVPDQWRAQGTDAASQASAYDYAVLEVTGPAGSRSLQETVGQALPLWTDAPRDLSSVTVRGYPQEAPFDGLSMYACTQAPGRLVLDDHTVPLRRIGCTMTGGASGGGWYATMPDGRTGLVGNSAVGAADNSWLAAPYLTDDAKALLDDIG